MRLFVGGDESERLVSLTAVESYWFDVRIGNRYMPVRILKATSNVGNVMLIKPPALSTMHVRERYEKRSAPTTLPISAGLETSRLVANTCRRQGLIFISSFCSVSDSYGSRMNTCCERVLYGAEDLQNARPEK